MRRIFLLIAVFLGLSVTASASISRDGFCSVSATSCTISGTPTSTSLQIAVAGRASATAATLPAGWTNVPTGGTVGTIVIAANDSVRIGCRISSSTASGTWTNATTLEIISYSGVPAIATTAHCANLATAMFATGTDGNLECLTAANCTGSAATTLTWRALANGTSDSTGWFAGFLFADAASFCAPTGLTLVGSSGNGASYDSNGTKASFAGSTCSISSEHYIQFMIQIVQAPSSCSGCAPSYVHITKTPDLDNGSQTLASGATVAVPLAWPTTAGQDIIVHYMAGTNAVTLAATDSAGSAYVLVDTCRDASNSGDSIGTLFAYNVAANITQVLLKASAATTRFQAIATEAMNVGTLDTSACNVVTSTSTSIASASITPAVTGEYLSHYFSGTSLTGAAGPYTASSQANYAAALRAVENFQSNGQGLEDGVYSSTSAITPTMTQTTASSFNSDVVAFLPTSQGGAPSGIYIAGAFYGTVEAGASTTETVQIPVSSSSDAIGILIDSGGSTCPTTSIVTAPTNTGNTIHDGCEISPSNIVGEDAYHITPTISLTTGIATFTYTLSSTAGGDAGIQLLDIHGVNTGAALDKYSSTNGNKTGTGNVNLLTLSPTNSCSELTVAGVSVDFNTANAISAPTGAWLLNGYQSANASNTVYYNNNGYGAATTASTSSITFTISFQAGINANVGDWASGGLTFDSAGCPVASSCSTFKALTGAGCK